MSNQTELIDFIAELSSSGADLQDYLYDILRVQPNAEQEVIESAYRRLLRMYHPDVNKHPLADNVTKILINAYEILGDPAKRAEYDEYFASRNSSEVETLLERSRESFLVGDYEIVVMHCTRVLEIEPNNAAAYNNRAAAYISLDSLELAILDFTRAIELEPNSASNYGGRAICYFNSQVWDLAIQDYTRVVEIEPTDANAYDSRGVAYLNLSVEYYDLALQDHTKAIEVDPEYSNAYYNRGNIYQMRGEFTAAIEDYTRALEIEPRNAAYKLALEEVVLKSSPPTELDRNVQKYTEAINLYPHRSSNYKFRGNAYLKIGEVELAIEDFNKAVELNPSSPSNYEHRAKAYAHFGDLDLAEEDFDTANRLRSEQQHASSAKKRPTSKSSASPRTSSNERTWTQPAGNSSTIWSQPLTSQIEDPESNQNYHQDLQQRILSVLGEYALASIIYATLAGLLMGVVVIFWNDTAAGILSAIFAILVLLFTWANDRTSGGIKILLILCGIVLAVGVSVVESSFMHSDGFIGAAFGMGAMFGITIALSDKN